ncbi:MAG: cytidylate kinase-like family protein [Bacteroidales bacterium]|nr:cytidylate kinase-like family protein [Bacteroidales bacterium]
MDKFVINIGRQLGSGGRAIGHILAKELGIVYYDREILTLAARESGFSQEIFERNDERKGFLRSVFGNIVPFFGSGSEFYANSLSEENLFQLQSEAIRKAAADHSCIFIGRCADYVLRDYPRCVNVFIAADMEDRIQRVCRLDKVDREAAMRLIARGDSRRADFYNFYSSGTWGAANTYHLCVNTSVLGLERTAELIKDFALKKLNA